MLTKTGRKSILTASLLAAVALIVGAGVAQVGCSSGTSEDHPGSHPSPGPAAEGVAGKVGVAITLPDGATINTVTYELFDSSNNPVPLPGQPNPGTIDVSKSGSIAFQLGGVPAASGDSITLSATTSAGGMCSGSASVSVTAGMTTTVHVMLVCSVPTADAGNVYVNGNASTCGTWTALSTAGSEVYVGESIVLNATAAGPDPGNLGYTWTMSNPIGAFGATTGGVGAQGQDEGVGPSDPMQFLCTAPGTTTITLVVDDGPVPAGFPPCPASLSTMTTTVICDAYPSNQVESAWVEIASGASVGDAGAGDAGVANALIARALTAAAPPDGGSNPCPAITINGGAPVQMNLRAAATTSLAVRSTIVMPSKPSLFPVSSCEFTLPAGTTSAVVAGHTLPLPPANPQKIVVLGDTGCRMQVGNGMQACNDPTQYPFSTIAALAAAQHPDLVIHVGDYEYRESECPPGMSSATGCGGSPWGYGWDSWEADFFAPGAPLLAAAPWIMVRGNHEMCNRSGQGWYRFLDTNPYDTTNLKTCNLTANDALATGGNYNSPYLVNINSNTQLVVFDSANGPKTVQATGSVPYMTYQSQLVAAGNLLSTPLTFNWWANHHPILGYSTGTPPALPNVSLPGLTPIFGAVFPNTYFPPAINLALHGHTHDYQAIDFAQGSYSNPATLVSGNAGDLLDTALPYPINSPVPGVTVGTVADAGADAGPGTAFATSLGFGYMVLQYDNPSGTWISTEYRVDNSVRDTCTLQSSGQLACASWGIIAP
jgi:hypothetical protein